MPILKRIAKVKPGNNWPVSTNSIGLSEDDPIAEHIRACQSIVGALKSPSINIFPFLDTSPCNVSISFARRSHVDLRLRYTQRIFRVVLLIPIVDGTSSVKDVPSYLS